MDTPIRKSKNAQMFPKTIVCFVLTSFLLLPGFTRLIAQSSSLTDDQFFNSNGVRIRYIVAGNGEPVIFIHGCWWNILIAS
jgi:hypothetical protein